jgi:hypothetical protein
MKFSPEYKRVISLIGYYRRKNRIPAVKLFERIEKLGIKSRYIAKCQRVIDLGLVTPSSKSCPFPKSVRNDRHEIHRFIKEVWSLNQKYNGSNLYSEYYNPPTIKKLTTIKIWKANKLIRDVNKEYHRL